MQLTPGEGERGEQSAPKKQLLLSMPVEARLFSNGLDERKEIWDGGRQIPGDELSLIYI